MKWFNIYLSGPWWRQCGKWHWRRRRLKSDQLWHTCELQCAHQCLCVSLYSSVDHQGTPLTAAQLSAICCSRRICSLYMYNHSYSVSVLFMLRERILYPYTKFGGNFLICCRNMYRNRNWKRRSLTTHFYFRLWITRPPPWTHNAPAHHISVKSDNSRATVYHFKFGRRTPFVGSRENGFQPSRCLRRPILHQTTKCEQNRAWLP